MYTLSSNQVDPTLPIGGKARALAALQAAALPIPPWFVVLPAAFHDSLTDEQRQQIAHTDDADMLRALVAAVQPSAALRAEIAAALTTLCPHGEFVAVRSSAVDEDGAQHSFAGQLESFLFVPAEQVADRVAAVWRSGFSERVITYRREHGLSLPPPAPAVLIQRMVPAEVAGVAFGADPVSGRRGVAVVAAVYGLGTSLVSGECDADTFHVDRDGNILSQRIATKRLRHVAAPGDGEGVRAEPVPDAQADAPALNGDYALAVAALAHRAGRFFGRPQDIEWAIAEGQLYLLQARPITTLAERADPDGARNLWDNSNIAESYSGITTPLTFSFARHVYEEVYRQFCRILRVPEAKLSRNDDIFRRMLGLIRGRIYYNLYSWYRALALLPGFTVNRRFMEQMMGVREGLPEDVANELRQSSLGERLADSWHLLVSAASLIQQHWRLAGTMDAFYRRLDAALGTSKPDLSQLRADELAAMYRDLELQLLKHWDAPLINDFLAMIFFGSLRKLTTTWCRDDTGSLHNDLLCGEGGMISAAPARRVRAMAELAAPHPELVAALCDGSRAAMDHNMSQAPAFAHAFQAYLDQFGDRCLEELKLESPTLEDDPLILLRSVGQLAKMLADQGEPNKAPPPQAESGNEDTPRAAAERRALAVLSWRQPIRRLIFRWVLRQARDRVRDRENLRFERTRLFGRVRRIFVELGRRFHELGLLDDPRDVFYLEVPEILGFVEGTATCADLRGLAATRKADFERYRQLPAPAERFETFGMVGQGNTYQNHRPAAAATPDGDSRQGLGCCPGIVRGPARVVRDPRHATLRHGDILVAERTDPGWVMLFPIAAGLLVERGSLLSHSAIVAREMGLPAIVGLGDVTHWLRDGDLVEMDGATGRVARIGNGEQG
ncbi:MAG: PEP/pyruvate-binding domain-containing protein [Gemmataceae bacterium]